jgi:two-component system OmpR family sensor kinase
MDGVLRPLHFAGVRSHGAGYLIVAARSRRGLSHLDEQLMRINSEQTDPVRAAWKDHSVVVGNGVERDEAVYDELTRVNNEMMNLQRELAKKNEELKELNEQKNRLLGMAAHDLRTPLGVILSYSESLQSEAAAALDLQQREFIDTIKEQSEFMLHRPPHPAQRDAEPGTRIPERNRADL